MCLQYQTVFVHFYLRPCVELLTNLNTNTAQTTLNSWKSFIGLWRGFPIRIIIICVGVSIVYWIRRLTSTTRVSTLSAYMLQFPRISLWEVIRWSNDNWWLFLCIWVQLIWKLIAMTWAYIIAISNLRKSKYTID